MLDAETARQIVEIYCGISARTTKAAQNEVSIKDEPRETLQPLQDCSTPSGQGRRKRRVGGVKDGVFWSRVWREGGWERVFWRREGGEKGGSGLSSCQAGTWKRE